MLNDNNITIGTLNNTAEAQEPLGSAHAVAAVVALFSRTTFGQRYVPQTDTVEQQ